MENPSSPLDTLRQLKEMLDARALTPAEFESLKQRLVFSSDAPLAVPALPPAPVPLLPVAAPTALPPKPLESAVEPLPLPPLAEAAASLPTTEAGPVRYFEPLAPLITPPPVVYEAPASAPLPEPEYVPEPELAAAAAPVADSPPGRSPLALVLAVVGVLGLLALVFYLGSNRHPSERLSSTSQTAADSVATTIDVGPQAEQLPQAAAEPETVRVAPAHPAPVVLPRQPAPPVRDSTAPVAPSAVPADSTAGR